jgi:hypothetical protein
MQVNTKTIPKIHNLSPMKVLGPTFNPLRASDRTRSNGPFHAGPGQWICALPAGAFSLSHFRSQGGIDILVHGPILN